MRLCRRICCWPVPALLATAAALAWAGPRPGELPHSSAEWTGLLAHEPVDRTIPLLAGLAAELCLLYLLLTALLVGCARLPGFTGRLAGALASRVAPAFLRRAVEAALGVAMATATVSAIAPPALAVGAADSRPQPAGTAAAPPADPVRRAPLPSLDRPAIPPREVPAPAPAPIPAPGPANTHAVVVRPGDSLWRIAARHLRPGSTDVQVAAAWPRWYAANRGVVGRDPDLLRPGQRLLPPVDPPPQVTDRRPR